jgi:hypothetical protein
VQACRGEFRSLDTRRCDVVRQPGLPDQGCDDAPTAGLAMMP